MMKGWANLPDGPAGLIAERLLASDVADYIRFRAACPWWRRCAADPRAHDGLDRRFHPRRWLMLRERRWEQLAAHHRRRFLNVSTGECIQAVLPELHGHEVLAVTPEGLLLLLRQRKDVRLLNPLTRHLIELPPVTALLPPEHHYSYKYLERHLAAWGSGIADDDSTVVLCFRDLSVLAVAKPGDQTWTLLEFSKIASPMTPPWRPTSPVMLAGRFYCVSVGAVMVLGINPRRFDVAARFHMQISPRDSVHLVDNGGDLIMVHRRRLWMAEDQSWITLYRVDLESGTLLPINSLGGARALFMGRRCSLSVPIEVCPSGSISGDTIYSTDSKDIASDRSCRAYHLPDRSITPAASYKLDGSVAQPHTLVECLALCTTVGYQDD